MKYDILVALYSFNYLIIIDLLGFVIELSIFELFILLSQDYILFTVKVVSRAPKKSDVNPDILVITCIINVVILRLCACSFLTNNVYNINKQEQDKYMQKRIQFPRRAQSLNIYKTQRSLQLPRFHSRPKNNFLAPNKGSNAVDSDTSNNINENKNSIKLTKNQMAQIVTKIKQKRYVSKNKQKKPISQKKITAYNKVQQDLEDKQKGARKVHASQRSLQVKGQNMKQQLSNRMPVSNNQKNSKKFNEFRSKSLKNAIKYQETQINRQNQKKTQKNIIKIEIKKKSLAESQVIKKKSLKSEPKNENKQMTEITTEATQPSNLTCDLDKKLWRKILQIFLNITLDPDNLDWPEEYIVMDKQMLEKKLYQILQQSQNTSSKGKIRKHICIARISIYLYSSLILHQTETKMMIPIFNKLHESFGIIVEVVSFGVASLNGQKSATIARNNQFNAKSLVKLLSKKSVPHQGLLKNMLESALKLQSIQFIQILDKTLKWEILKMPSYPYLPPCSKELFLVLDLDETLIHYDYTTELFHVRPFAEEFLKKASSLFQITIFTAALQEYADEILDQIDPEHCISYKLYRNHLTYIDGVPIKDISMLGRPLNKTIIVDNIANNYRLQPQNGILIRSWYDDDNDEALGKLYGFLLKISESYSNDVRIGIRELSQYIKQQITKADLIYELQRQL